MTGAVATWTVSKDCPKPRSSLDVTNDWSETISPECIVVVPAVGAAWSTTDVSDTSRV